MDQLSVILGVVCSQPIGIPDSERERLYEHSYKPLLKAMYNAPRIRFTLYFSGIVFEWLEKAHSEFVDVLAEMTKRRQVELLGGGFYEPFFPLIPKTDRIGQMERLTTLIRKRFGRRPRGAWVPGGVWDQRITSNLQNGGLEYTFLRAGAEHPPGKAVLTEDQGKLITVFPLCEKTGHRLFVDPPEDVVRQFLESADPDSGPAPVLSLMIDANAFDVPDAAQRIAWFAAFLRALELQGNAARTRLASKVHRMLQGTLDRCSFPATTFSELGVVDGTAQSDRRTFRALLEEHVEAQRMYAKMQHTHLLVNQVRGDKYRKQNAREDLWRGQSHFAYWSNGTGGIYRSQLRKATFASLIEAEKNTREVGIFMPSLARIDFDLDGLEEVLFQGNDFNAYVHRRGAYVFELDHLRRNWNFLDTMCRRPEPYHDAEVRAEGYDAWPRSAFVDHLFTPEQTLTDFAAGRRRQVVDIGSLLYVIEDIDKDHNTVRFAVQCFNADSLATLRIVKEYQFQKNRIDVTYQFHNDSLEPFAALFGSEVNLSFYSNEVADLRMNVRQGRQRREIAPTTTELEGVADVQYQDVRNKVAVSIVPSDRPEVWSLPVYATGLVSGVPTSLYQSNATVARWNLALAPGGAASFSIGLRFEPLR